MIAAPVSAVAHKPQSISGGTVHHVTMEQNQDAGQHGPHRVDTHKASIWVFVAWEPVPKL